VQAVEVLVQPTGLGAKPALPALHLILSAKAGLCAAAGGLGAGWAGLCARTVAIFLCDHPAVGL
jgi:hypothetical protein